MLYPRGAPLPNRSNSYLPFLVFFVPFFFVGICALLPGCESNCLPHASVWNSPHRWLNDVEPGAAARLSPHATSSGCNAKTIAISAYTCAAITCQWKLTKMLRESQRAKKVSSFSENNSGACTGITCAVSSTANSAPCSRLASAFTFSGGTSKS